MTICLHVNIDHVATLREARKGVEPCPLKYAELAEQSGVHGITVHLREDRRHIQDQDVINLRHQVQTRLNLEIAATEEMLAFALEVQPDMVTLVPERREELTTEGGLDVVTLIQQSDQLKQTIETLRQNQILVSLFVDPNVKQIRASHEVHADQIELHTGTYAQAHDTLTRLQALEALEESALEAHQHGLQVNAGHGLDYQNVQAVCELPHLKELNIGHSIVSYSLIKGVSHAVQEMLTLISDV